MEALEILLKHRTIRKYKSETVPDNLMEKLLKAGIRASTTGNMQVYSIIHTSDPQIKQKLAPAHFNQPMVLQAPHILTFCADFNRFKRWCCQRNAEPGYDNFLSFMTAAIDALLVAQNVAVAAESEGLGICYLGTTLYNADAIIEILKLPRGVVPITTLTLGWPAEQPEQVERLPLDAVVHDQVYRDYTPESIDRYYSEKEHLEANQKFVQENKKTSLAQVFTDIRYKKADNEYFTEKLLAVLKNQGYINTSL